MFFLLYFAVTFAGSGFVALFVHIELLLHLSPYPGGGLSKAFGARWPWFFPTRGNLAIAQNLGQPGTSKAEGIPSWQLPASALPRREIFRNPRRWASSRLLLQGHAEEVARIQQNARDEQRHRGGLRKRNTSNPESRVLLRGTPNRLTRPSAGPSDSEQVLNRSGTRTRARIGATPGGFRSGAWTGSAGWLMPAALVIVGMLFPVLRQNCPQLPVNIRSLLGTTRKNEVRYSASAHFLTDDNWRPTINFRLPTVPDPSSSASPRLLRGQSNETPRSWRLAPAHRAAPSPPRGFRNSFPPRRARAALPSPR